MASAEQTAAQLRRNVVQALPAGELERKLDLGRPLRVKLGIDPTAPDIHVGHTVVLRKLREFQDAGHKVVLIVGDFTARVGDPSGRSELRPRLSREQIDENAATFTTQATKILDADTERLEVRRNAEWLEMDMTGLLRLLATTTAGQLLSREDFAKRLEARSPVSMLELLYPLLQAYDSVAVGADVEVGGTDQTFNLLLGRDVQRAYGQPEQAIMTLPILVGTDGRRKMSKSLGNQIGLTEPASEIYGKTLSVPDDVVGDYFRLVLGAEAPAGLGPRDAKRLLARELVSLLHSPAAAASAEENFDRVFVHHGEPAEVMTAAFRADNGVVHLPALLGEIFGISRSEARRLIETGAVHVDDREILALDVEASCLDGRVLRVGRRRFRRLHAA